MFFMWSNIMRHAIVIAIFLYISKQVLEKRKMCFYLLMVMALMLIHKSAILLLMLAPFFI